MKKALLVLIFIAVGCRQKAAAPQIHMSLINNQQSLQITGLEAAVLAEIGRDSSSAVWQSLVPVYRMPADTDMKDYQNPQPGKYRVNDSAIVFTPDTPFAKQQTYFVRYYLFEQHNTPLDYIKGSHKPGSAQHMDLIFKQ